MPWLFHVYCLHVWVLVVTVSRLKIVMALTGLVSCLTQGTKTVQLSTSALLQARMGEMWAAVQMKSCHAENKKKQYSWLLPCSVFYALVAVVFPLAYLIFNYRQLARLTTFISKTKLVGRHGIFWDFGLDFSWVWLVFCLKQLVPGALQICIKRLCGDKSSELINVCWLGLCKEWAISQ